MSSLKFIFPTDGDFVNKYDGEIIDNTLYVDFLIETDSRDVSVCGIKADFDEKSGYIKAKVPLYGYRNRIIAKTETEEKFITVFALSEEKLKKFRLSSDDNIRFLKELTEGDYRSIFDHPYLAIYKKAHDLFGAKVHLNLFYAFDEKARGCFSGKHDYFDLSMMTDRYKEEFIKNSSWLKLAFHAESEFPDRPYKYADREKIKKDVIKICKEICRFAGKDCISNSTTIHWGEANREVIRELRALGFTSLTGYFIKTDSNEPLVSYYFENEMVDHIGNRDFFMDTKEDMIFGRIDTVLNSGTIEKVLNEVNFASNDLHRGGFVSIMIHEQYFYKGYRNYLPDFEERVLKSCEMLYNKGYKGAHVSEITKERALMDYPEFI